MSLRSARGIHGILERVKSGTYVAARLPTAARAPAALRKKVPSAAWRIYVGADFSTDIGEGPFTTRAAAVDFAKHEVGVAWSVRRDGAAPKASDPTWSPETDAQRRRRAAKEQVIIDENRRFREAEDRFQREHPEASAMEYGRFVAEWGAANATTGRGR